ncbi:unnamed protein product [Pedinophyceae sp. YPF-701]|nr:unnamed protein product [Pedinophyceae sp. YPF-701]
MGATGWLVAQARRHAVPRHVAHSSRSDSRAPVGLSVPFRAARHAGTPATVPVATHALTGARPVEQNRDLGVLLNPVALKELSSAKEVKNEFILTLACADATGIVYNVTGLLFADGCNIIESSQFGDRDGFFLRVHFAAPRNMTQEMFERDFEPLARRFGMQWQLRDRQFRPRVVLMVSKAGHCLNDLLYRWRSGQLSVDVVHVISNHATLAPAAAAAGVPFTHLPVTADTKRAQEAALLELIESLDADLVVLARYMQILSTELCAALAGRCINIHHSFLPSFKGGRPYHQAHERGVKLIGATAHYVTADLDEGPIIEQDVCRVNHGMSAEELADRGQDIESIVLARAVRWHTENRVLLRGHRTIVFE